MNRLRMGVVGVGRFGQHHASVLAQLPVADLVGICDVDAGRARAVADRLGVGAAVTDATGLLALDPDAVTIATGIGQHVEPVLAALEAGCHVLCEKPVANTAAEVAQLADAARRARRFLMPGHVLRFDIHYQTVAARVAAGRLGRIRSIYCRRNVGREHLDWHAPPFTPVLETGLHDIDVIRWLTGSEVARVYAVRSRSVRPDLDDSYWAVLTLADGTICGLETSWLIPRGDPSQLEARLELMGTEGRATIVLPNDTVQVSSAAGAEHPDTAYWPVGPAGTRGAIYAELEYFVRCCLDAQPPVVVTIDDARQAVAVAEAIHRSAEIGDVVEVETA